MKVYTRGGDKGKTHLADGSRVLKSHSRVKAYGELDELSCCIGLLKDLLQSNLATPEISTTLLENISHIQQHLYYLSSEIAGLKKSKIQQDHLLTDTHVRFLEETIDQYSRNLPILKHFVLPGGHFLNSYSHICRTVCRRAERSLIELNNEESIRNECIQYINRLSDLLFTIARLLSEHLKVAEPLAH